MSKEPIGAKDDIATIEQGHNIVEDANNTEDMASETAPLARGRKQQYQSIDAPVDVSDNDCETLDERMELAVRHGFVRKGFGILTVQLLVTTLIATPFVVWFKEAHRFILNYQALFFIAAFLPLILMCVAACNPRLMRTYPTNYIFLSTITVAMGLTVGVVCVQYTVQSIVFAAGITTVITFGLTMFAMQTKYDFTSWGPYLMCFMLAMIGCSFVFMFFPPSRPVELVYCGIGVILFSFYIVYDVQMIVGGKHNMHRFQLDDYCFAALAIYIDIINLFLYMLRIFGDRR